MWGFFLWLLNTLMIYSLYTLVDITRTGQYRTANHLERSQQQNFDTVIQTIGLRGNIYYDKSPVKIPATIFGLNDKMCWYFEWEMEIEHLFEQEDNPDPIIRLKDLFEYVPFIDNLTEPIQFNKPIFRLGQNIIFDYKQ